MRGEARIRTSLSWPAGVLGAPIAVRGGEYLMRFDAWRGAHQVFPATNGWRIR